MPVRECRKRGHLGVLHVERGVREERVVSYVVIVEVAQDDVLDLRAIDADLGQSLGRAPEELASTPRADRFGEAQVHHHRVCSIGEGPDEVVHRHR